MASLKKRSKKVEQERHAQANNSAVSESAPDKSILESGGESEETIEQGAADKCAAKIHYYSRSVAREHGINAATVLAGFAFKLKHHKLNWELGRYWYYETLETLCERRRPYFAPSGLCGIILYLSEEAKLLIKDCHNTMPFDSTNWYAIEDEVRDTALTDSIWFDVRVAKMDRLGIAGATIYHNIRFHLRELLRLDPTIGIPYHEVNKKQLARDLPMSYSTVKRMVEELIAAGLIKSHPKKTKWFTLTDLAELGLVVPSGSSTNENGSNVNGSNANRNGSSANTSGSSANENGSDSCSNTQSETGEKACQKPIRNSADPDCEESLSGDEDGTSSEGTKTSSSCFSQQDWSTAKKSFTPTRTKFVEVLAHNRSVIQSPTFLKFVSPYLAERCSWFFSEALSTNLIQKLLTIGNCDRILQTLAPELVTFFEPYIKDCADEAGVSVEVMWPLIIYPSLEVITKSFMVEEIWSGTFTCTFPDHEDTIGSLYDLTESRIEGDADLSAAEKLHLFRGAIERRNRHGWRWDETVKFHAVCISTKGMNAIEGLLSQNPHLAVEPLLRTLTWCLRTKNGEPESSDRDQYWYARRGDDLEFFAQHLNKIVRQLEMEEVCPVTSI